MPLELGVWRIDSGLEQVQISALELESRLEDILEQDITIASPNWMVIGRQVRTDFDKYIDLLAMDGDGNLVVIELKRDKTYRDIQTKDRTRRVGSVLQTHQMDDKARDAGEFPRRNLLYDPERLARI